MVSKFDTKSDLRNTFDKIPEKYQNRQGMTVYYRFGGIARSLSMKNSGRLQEL
jgi:hypothetical protein